MRGHGSRRNTRDDGKAPIGRIRRLLTLVAEYKGRFALATFFLIFGSAAGLVYPQAIRYAIDEGIEGGSLETLNYIALGLLVLFVFQAFATWIRHYLMSWLGERVVADLRQRVFDRLLHLDLDWFHRQRTGELVSRLASDVSIVEGVVGSELSISLRNMMQLIGGLTLLFYEDWRLTLFMLTVIPPLSIAVVLFGRKIRKMSRAMQDRVAETGGRVQEALGAIDTVQAFNRQRSESERYGEGVEEVFAQALQLARWRASFMSASSFAGFLAIGLVVWAGGRAVAQGELSSGSLTAFMLYTITVAVALGSLTGIWSSLQRAAGATDRIFDVIDAVPAIKSADQTTALPSEGTVEFDDVAFTYATRSDHPVLEGIDLKVAEGETVALVGPSGAGKTTITSLIARFYDVTSGTLKVAGVDVRELDLMELRGVIATVPQEPILFSGTIEENIGYGNANANRADIERAAKDANALQFIEEFPDGFATEVGERGVQLSGGQKQRVAIARAILAEPRILILDEATSNLDSESEALVQSALQRLMRGRTTFVIAHRLSTVKDADRILVIERGRIAEEGTHESLMQQAGVYKRLVEHQLAA